ncbi:MAG: Ig-like domain-containing protein [Desulfuromonadaceae bacterium]|nr:Ig-like domain-containing protein [Desulfuromonadaceae bacterium]
MKNRRIPIFIALTLMFALIGFWSMPQNASAVVPQVPTGPKTLGDPADTTVNPVADPVPDYYTTANWANSPMIPKFVDTLPGLNDANNLGQMLPVAVADQATYPGSDYYVIGLVQYTEQMHTNLNPTTLRGYVQLNDDGANGKNYTSYLNNRAPELDAHYLGPIIVAQRDRPVRVKFVNMLPSGADGNLFIPVDTTVMGAGPGPAAEGGTNCNNDVPGVYGNTNPGGCASYTQNRADLHLHGGRTPWISDGTPHQWIIPADDFDSAVIPFKQGVSMQNVPDMPAPGTGESTYYWTNQQSARLMFYHDHAFGITRLNVYAGEAAGYVITDDYEQDLIDRGIIPGTATGGATVMGGMIPLILQDKTFVDATPTTKLIYNPATGLFDTPITVPKVRETDPLWNWGTSAADADGVIPPVTGDLWLPHVYMPAQTSTAGAGGVNPFGRWMYGPWFYPPTVVDVGPQANPYYDSNCSSSNPFLLADCQTPGQPELIPGTPNVSMGMEAFQDSAVVNGTVFPTVTVDPKAYRFKILNAASDRFFNLSFYKADPAQLSAAITEAVDGRGYLRSKKTEVKMVPAGPTAGWPVDWPVDGRDGGVPDPGTCTGSGSTYTCANWGPKFLQIGTEGGFLPQPVEINPQPITYNIDPTAFWVGNVDKMGLAVGPAERADVIVDFSAYEGQTLILYNDAPAAWPARVAGYDYYTDAPDLRDSGGYGTGGTFNQETGAWEGGTGPLPGYAPNTRTVMQVIVRSGTVPAFNKTALEAEFTAPPSSGPYAADGKTLFARAQEPIVVGQAAYQTTYPNSYFPTNFPWEGINQMNDHFLQFVTLAGEKVVIPTEPKGIHDEMGASFDPVYGRMSGNLAMQIPNPTTLTANLILYGFSDIPSETVNNSIGINVEVLPSVDSSLPGTTSDGTQIWKISHNGVDTHPIHFHIFDVQLINRVGWDGQILMPEPNELGWKDTVKISPLEDTIVAVRPRAPALPFGIPNSLRPLNPAIPIDSTMGFNNVDWVTGNPRTPVVTNILYNFGWEYVWHCHILSHEEMDMMRPIVLNYVAALPPAFTPTVAAGTGTTRVITLNDPTPVVGGVPADPEAYRNAANEIGFNIYRGSSTGSYTMNAATNKPVPINAAAIPANTATYSMSAINGATYRYIVEAFNAAGSTVAYIGSPFTVAVTKTSPTGAATSPGPITLRATVTNKPTQALVSRVDFYNGTTFLGSKTNATTSTTTFNFSWTNVPKGTHSITAIAYHNFPGGSIVSPALSLPVTSTITANFTPNDATSFGVCNGAVSNSIPFVSTSTVSSGTLSPVLQWTLDGVILTNTTNFSMPVPAVGTHQMTLLVKKTGTGTVASDQITKSFTITNSAPVADAGGTGAVNGAGGTYTVNPGENLTLAGSATDADACDLLTYYWDLDNKNGYEYTSTTLPFAPISHTSLWKVLGAGTFTISFKVTDPNGGVDTKTATLIIGAPANPTVSLSAPADGAVYLPGDSITLTATAAAGTGATVTKVEFFDGATLLNTDYSTPYSYVWAGATAGAHSLTAKVTDSKGLATTSAAVGVTVGVKSALTAPTMPFTFTGNSQTFTWDNVGVSQYGLDIGTSAGTANIFGYRGTATSVPVFTLPTDGSTVYVRLWSFMVDHWEFTDYTFTAAVKSALSAPTMPFTFTGNSQTFTWSDVGVSQYGLDIGTSAGTANIFGYRGTATSVPVFTLPTDGSTVYVRLWSFMGDHWEFTDYTFTAAVKSALTAPTMPFTFTGNSQTFTWSNVGVSQYGLDIGTSVDSANIFGYRGTATSVPVFTLPTDGSTVYVRLWSFMGDHWEFTDYTFTAAVKSALSAPTMPFTFTGNSQTFTWSNVGVSQYGLDIGTSAGTANIFGYRGTATSVPVFTLPTDGSTVYVRLWSFMGDHWEFTDYTFTAAVKSALSAPTMPFTFTGNSQTFTWSDVGVSQYGLDIGTSVDTANIFGYRGIATSVPVTTLPTDGSTVYVRLWSFMGDHWEFTDYTFTAFGP